VLSDDNLGRATVTFDDRHELELDSLSVKVHEFHTYFPDEQEVVSPWVSFALSA
jgi:hypothetical protein